MKNTEQDGDVFDVNVDCVDGSNHTLGFSRLTRSAAWDICKKYDAIGWNVRVHRVNGGKSEWAWANNGQKPYVPFRFASAFD